DAGLGVRYTATFGDETATQQWLVLTARPGTEVNWPQLRARFDKTTMMVDQIEDLEDGKVKRVQTRSKYAGLDGGRTYQLVEMKTVADKLTTTVEMLEQHIGQPLDDAMFSKKALVRGH